MNRLMLLLQISKVYMYIFLFVSEKVENFDKYSAKEVSLEHLKILRQHLLWWNLSLNGLKRYGKWTRHGCFSGKLVYFFEQCLFFNGRVTNNCFLKMNTKQCDLIWNHCWSAWRRFPGNVLRYVRARFLQVEGI